MSVTFGEPRSRMRTAASMESSSKGFMLCFTPAVSIAVRAELTRGLTCEGGGALAESRGMRGGQLGRRGGATA
jgi:hypothetical protein